MGNTLFKRINASPNVAREKKFLIEVPAGDVDSSLAPPISEETVVIQGAIDCLFEEDGEIVVVDFKTDRTDDPDLLKGQVVWSTSGIQQSFWRSYFRGQSPV